MITGNLILPMAAMVFLTVIVLTTLFRRRVRAVRSQQVSLSYYSTYQGATEPEFAAQASRHFSNLFEAPTLFYIACLAAMASQRVTTLFVALAWGYVVARYVHAYVHLGSNRIGNRVRIYFASWVILVVMWIVLIAGTIM